MSQSKTESKGWSKQATPAFKESEYISAASEERKDQAMLWLQWTYSLLLLATMSIFFLQGFRLGGFSLDTKVLLWLGGVTVGEIGGLLVIAFRGTFR